MDSSDGPEHVLQADDTWIVTRGGTATQIVDQPGPRHAKTIELSLAELRRIKVALSDLNLSALEQHFGTDDEGDGTTVVTYGGHTVTLDSRIMGFAPVNEAPRVARPFARLMISLRDLSD